MKDKYYMYVGNKNRLKAFGYKLENDLAWRAVMEYICVVIYFDNEYFPDKKVRYVYVESVIDDKMLPAEAWHIAELLEAKLIIEVEE